MANIRKILEVVLAFLGALLAAVKVADAADGISEADSPRLDDERDTLF